MSNERMTELFHKGHLDLSAYAFELEKKLAEYENGKGACLTCEPVGMLNKEIEKRLEAFKSIQDKYLQQKGKLAIAVEALEFYGDPEMWMIKNNNGWIQNSPKSHGDHEMILSYKHPKTDWIGSIQIGGKRARQVLKQIRGDV